MDAKIAFVSGANGVSGNALIEHLIRQPKEEWGKIIISSRRPLANYWQDPRIEFIAVDFLQPLDTIIQKLRRACKNVTHAYYCSYVHTADFSLLSNCNEPLWRNFLDSIDAVAPRLQRVCLQTGTKHYGCHKGPVPLPVNESVPRYEDNGENFYYKQEDYLFNLTAKRPWSYNIIRPHAIVGFAPGANGMSQAITSAIYFLVCKELGEPVQFPGNEWIYNTFDDSSHSLSLADMTVYLTTLDKAANEDFIHCNGDVYVWKYFWPRLAAYFGVDASNVKFSRAKGQNTNFDNEFSMVDWAKDKRPVWESICAKYGGKAEAFDWGTWQFVDWSLGKAWATVATTAKARSFGWKRIDDTYNAWTDTFRSFGNAGVIPTQAALLDASELDSSDHFLDSADGQRGSATGQPRSDFTKAMSS